MSKPGFHPREQGDVGEAYAIVWLTDVGAKVSTPLFHSPDYDLIADFGEGLLRVQVKTSGCVMRGRYKVQVATSGGNRSWTGAVKYFDRHRCDALFVRLVDGRQWLIPASAVDASTTITLGGRKYSEYQIHPGGGIPLAARRALESSALRGSAGVGEPGRTVNPVASPEWVRIPPPPSSPPRLAPVKERAIGRTRISSGHQLTISIGPFRSAGLAPGDQLEVTAEGPGELRLRRVHEAPTPTPAQPELTTPGAPEPEEAA
jgi:hypothetical protein